MSILRVLLAAAPDAVTATAWALYDEPQRLVRTGSGPAANWPAATRREAVLAASAVRIVPVALPPMPADRIPAAAAFALEDRLAGPAPTRHLAVAPRQPDGTVEVAIVTRDLVASVARDYARVIAESALAPKPPPGTWRWYASGAGGSFVRGADGTAFAVPLPTEGAPLPPELVVALASAAQVSATPTRVEVAFPVAAPVLAAWSRHTHATFVAVAPWRWDDDAVALAGAPDLLQGEFARVPRPPRADGLHPWRVPVAIGALAVGLHVVATFAQWALWHVESWRTQRAIVAVARDAGVRDAADADTAMAALRDRVDAARQRVGRPAPHAALPLLARAAPALGALPPGAVKSATFAAGAWTLELARLDAASAARLDRELTSAGLATLTAAGATGVRLRLAPTPDTAMP